MGRRAIVIHVGKPGRELVAFVVKRGRDYFVSGSDESDLATSTDASEAHRWTIENEGYRTKDIAYDEAKAAAIRWRGRVVGITVPGRLRQAKPRSRARIRVDRRSRLRKEGARRG
jgi:hypothetical protein